MNYHLIKPVIGGLILGAILFFFPFFAVKVLGFFLIIATIFWVMRGRRAHWRKFAWVHPDKIRSMSDEEYESYKANFGRSHCHRGFRDVQDDTENDSTENKA